MKTLFHVVILFCAQSMSAAFLITTAVSLTICGSGVSGPKRPFRFGFWSSCRARSAPGINAIGTVIFGTSILLVALGMLVSGVGKSFRPSSDS